MGAQSGKKIRLGFVTTWLAVVLAASLGACNMPGKSTPAPSGYQLINTAAAMTVAAQLTEISKPPVATVQPTQKAAVLTPTGAVPTQGQIQPSQSLAVTVVPQPTPAPQAGACDRAKFVKDVTVPDNTALQPGATFTKTWRLKNVGQCTWNKNYALVFTGGDPLGAASEVALPVAVGPGDTVDISVNMTAPAESGVYRSEWKLSNAANQVFGSGKNGDLPIWAQIRVAGANAGNANSNLQYDFVSSASSATWYSGAGDTAGQPLAFGGPLDNPNGAALIANGLHLESGQTSGKVLLTVPMLQQNGYVYGIFPVYAVQAGDHLRARVGFATNPDGQCGQGQVIFQIAYKAGDTTKILQEIPATCDGTLTPVDLDLSALRGNTVQFIFNVRANGSAQANSAVQDNWAIWNSPQISNP